MTDLRIYCQRDCFFYLISEEIIFGMVACYIFLSWACARALQTLLLISNLAFLISKVIVELTVHSLQHIIGYTFTALISNVLCCCASIDPSRECRLPICYQISLDTNAIHTVFRMQTNKPDIM